MSSIRKLAPEPPLKLVPRQEAAEEALEAVMILIWAFPLYWTKTCLDVVSNLEGALGGWINTTDGQASDAARGKIQNKIYVTSPKRL